MPLFPKTIVVQHKHEVDAEGLTEAAKPVLDRLSHIMKTAGIALAIGIPSVILFAVTANVAGEVLADRMIDHQ